MLTSTLDIIQKLEQPIVQQYIFDHEMDDERAIALRQKNILEIPAGVMADQIKGRRKAQEKLPLWYQTKGIVYPPSLHLEQASSAWTASFKVSLMSKTAAVHHSVCDLTGGFGVDAFHFATLFKEIDVIDPNASLLAFTKHNHQLLGVSGARYFPATAEEFLEKNQGHYDFIFVDPSRRNKDAQKTYRFSESVPNITPMMDLLLSRCDHLMIKAAPMLDIQAGFHELKGVTSAFVVSLDNEVKEILFLCRRGALDEPLVHTVNLTSNPDRLSILPATEPFTFSFSEERSAHIKYGDPHHYLFEPHPSIMKAGAFKLIAQRYELEKIHPSTHLYTGNSFIQSFPGRVFEILEKVKPDKKLKEKFPGGQANIMTRNYPLSVEEIKKKTGLTEGGHQYLICCSGQHEKWVMTCSRLR